MLHQRTPMKSRIDLLRAEAREVASRSLVPYSSEPTGVVCLLSDGWWVPGVRVENASFPLTLPALLNAVTTCVAFGRTDILAVVKSGPFASTERGYLVGLFDAMSFRSQDCCVVDSDHGLPEPLGMLPLPANFATPTSPGEGILLARRFAARAQAPTSDFPVGCAVVSVSGHVVPGCNVEHPEWMFTLCAERNALGTAASYGLIPDRLYLSCPRDPSASPCGACRQVITEFGPDLPVWMDRGQAEPEVASASDLLPHAFDGALLRHPK